RSLPPDRHRVATSTMAHAALQQALDCRNIRCEDGPCASSSRGARGRSAARPSHVSSSRGTRFGCSPVAPRPNFPPASRRYAATGIGHTILRATQFHELLSGALLAVERWPIAPLPLSWRFQPIAAEDVAARAVELLVSDPQGRAADLGGPEVLTVDEMVRIWR